MIELLISVINVQTLTMVFAAVAAAATVLTLAMPLVAANPLDKRMRAVALEREKIRQRERERMMQEKQKISLRQSPKQYVQTIVDRFNLNKWFAQEEAHATCTFSSNQPPQESIDYCRGLLGQLVLGDAQVEGATCQSGTTPL